MNGPLEDSVAYENGKRVPRIVIEAFLTINLLGSSFIIHSFISFKFTAFTPYI